MDPGAKVGVRRSWVVVARLGDEDSVEAIGHATPTGFFAALLTMFLDVVVHGVDPHFEQVHVVLGPLATDLGADVIQGDLIEESFDLVSAREASFERLPVVRARRLMKDVAQVAEQIVELVG